MSKKDDIRRVLCNSDKPLSTNKVADKAGFNWHTADKHLKCTAEIATYRPRFLLS
ncbi:hypothetical protein [Halalkalicoccus salilacus]|uniref:hypothetical protein n=1 Tax=Halalkalicoccus salilacus TaxID=3117459 RepID=UPI00300F2516